MPQRELPRANPAMNANHDSANDVLPEGTTIHKREDGAVIKRVVIQKPTAKDGSKSGADYSEVRIDSRQDHDMIARGEVPWYVKHLKPKTKTQEVPK